jgi:uncharacterized protein (TIGR02246 family)
MSDVDAARARDEAEIRALVARWMEATRAGDGAAVLEMMTEDVVFLVPGRAPFGKAEFAAMSQAQAGIRLDGRSEPIELRLLGDHAYLISKLQLTATPAQGEPVRRAGHTLTIFRRDSGRWLLARDANLLAPA